jgi:hypothetical protein
MPVEITFDPLKLALGVFQQTHGLSDFPTTLRRRARSGDARDRHGDAGRRHGDARSRRTRLRVKD